MPIHLNRFIDRAAAAELPSTEGIREWAAGKRVFVSSVMSEMKVEREAAADAIRSIGAKPILFELFGGRDADPEDAYLGEVETSEIYIGLLGARYGKPLPNRYSATHAEYLHSESRGLRIAIWNRAEASREGHEQSFLDEIRVFHVTSEFRSIDELKLSIQDRLRSIAAEDLAPWCKVGSTIFRANHIVDNGSEISLKALIRTDAVAHALESLRGDRIGRGVETTFTGAGRSKYVRVTGVQSTIYVDCLQIISATTMDPARTFRWTRMLRHRGRFN